MGPDDTSSNSGNRGEGSPSSSPHETSPESPSGRPSQSGGLSDWLEALNEMAPYLDLGWRLAGSAAVPPILGYFLVDVWLGTAPWGLLAGAGVGLASVVLQLKQLQQNFDR